MDEGQRAITRFNTVNPSGNSTCQGLAESKELSASIQNPGIIPCGAACVVQPAGHPGNWLDVPNPTDFDVPNPPREGPPNVPNWVCIEIGGPPKDTGWKKGNRPKQLFGWGLLNYTPKYAFRSTQTKTLTPLPSSKPTRVRGIRREEQDSHTCNVHSYRAQEGGQDHIHALQGGQVDNKQKQLIGLELVSDLFLGERLGASQAERRSRMVSNQVLQDTPRVHLEMNV